MHHLDYDHPLDVMWLCRAHHAAWHRYWRAVALDEFERWVAAQHRAMSSAESSASPKISGETTH
jgi:hypothetical protein